MSGGYQLGNLCNTTDIGYDSANTRGTAVVSGPGGTYGSYTQLTAATVSDINWVNLQLFWPAASVGGQVAVKLAVGAAGSEIDVVSDLMFNNWTGNSRVLYYSVPISIPLGARISAAVLEKSATGDTFYIFLNSYCNDYATPQSPTSFASLGNTLGQGMSVTSGAANTKGSYTQLTAATAQDFIGVILAMDTINTGVATNRFSLDLAVGAAASEFIILSNIMFSYHGGDWATVNPFIPLQIPAGTRLSLRMAEAVGSKSMGVTFCGAY